MRTKVQSEALCAVRTAAHASMVEFAELKFFPEKTSKCKSEITFKTASEKSHLKKEAGGFKCDFWGGGGLKTFSKKKKFFFYLVAFSGKKFSEWCFRPLSVVANTLLFRARLA